jgi:hypothetical protein
MSVSTCPVATIHAPAERVWHLLSQPDSYALWWDAHTLSITPEGPAKPGQQVRAQAAALGRWWPIDSTRLIARFRLVETSLSRLYGGDGYSSGSLRSNFIVAWRNRWHDLSVPQKVRCSEDVEPTRSVQAIGLLVQACDALA